MENFVYAVRITVLRNGQPEILEFSVKAPVISKAREYAFLIVGCNDPIDFTIQKVE